VSERVLATNTWRNLMHGVLITFTSSLASEAVAQPFHDYAIELQSVPGLLQKVWLQSDTTRGGFHVFTSGAAADTYLDSALVAGLMNTPGFSDFAVQRFDVLEDLSAMTGVRATVR
jgi:hypothetical protein